MSLFPGFPQRGKAFRKSQSEMTYFDLKIIADLFKYVQVYETTECVLHKKSELYCMVEPSLKKTDPLPGGNATWVLIPVKLAEMAIAGYFRYIVEKDQTTMNGYPWMEAYWKRGVSFGQSDIVFGCVETCVKISALLRLFVNSTNPSVLLPINFEHAHFAQSNQMSRRTRSPSNRKRGSSVVYGSDHDRYNEESEVYDALSRAVKDYNHRVVDANIRLDVLDQVDKNKRWVVVPFATTFVASFTELASDISKRLRAEVDISAEVDVSQDAQLRFCFNILRESFGKVRPSESWWRSLLRQYGQRILSYLVVVFVFWWLFFAESSPDLLPKDRHET